MPWQVPLNSLCACLFFRNICCCNYVNSLRCRWRWAVKTDVAFCCFSLLKDSVWFCFMRGMNTNRKSEFVFQRNSEPWRIRSGWMRWPVLSCNLPLQELHLFLVWAGLGAVMHHYLGWSELIIMGHGLVNYSQCLSLFGHLFGLIWDQIWGHNWADLGLIMHHYLGWFEVIIMGLSRLILGQVWLHLGLFVRIGFRFWADLESVMGHYWGWSTVSLG